MTTILLIEDALDLAQVIQRELQAAGYQVRHASDGMAGLQLLTQQPPDLVILDWMLPRMDGLEVLRRMRKSSAVPVLMLTARGFFPLRHGGQEDGCPPPMRVEQGNCFVHLPSPQTGSDLAT